MNRQEAEGLLYGYLSARDRARDAASQAFGPSTPAQREVAGDVIREAAEKREVVIMALVSGDLSAGPRQSSNVLICKRCGNEMWSPQTFSCECRECVAHTEHLKQCGTCGDQRHYRGPKPGGR